MDSCPTNANSQVEWTFFPKFNILKKNQRHPDLDFEPLKFSLKVPSLIESI